jgi:hypothetical protein
MPLSYSSQHERLFIEKKNAWVDCSLDEISYPEGLSEESTNAANCDIKVVETACDWCKKIDCKPSFFFFIFVLFVYLIGMYMIISYVVPMF